MSYVRISAPNERVSSTFMRAAVSGMTTITRLPSRMPANAMPDAKFPEEWATTGRSPIRARLRAIQCNAPSSLNEPTGVHP